LLGHPGAMCSRQRRSGRTHVLARIPHKIILLAIAGAALIGAGVGAGTYAAVGGGSKTTTKIVSQPTAASSSSSSSSSSTLTSQQSQLSAGEIYERDSRSVVEITVTTHGSSGNFFGPGGGSQQAQGSGFVY